MKNEELRKHLKQLLSEGLACLKYNIPKNHKFEISDESQKYYEDFFQKNFTIFSYQFVRRGLKILDIHEIRNHFSYYFHSFFKF